MDSSYSNFEQNQEQNIISFIVGQEYKSTSLKDNRNYLTLALLSIVIALYHSLAIAFLIQLHIDQLMIAIVVFLLCFILIILFNRIYFVSKNRNSKGSMLLPTIYVLFYLILSFTVVPQIFTYYYLLDEITAVKTGDSALKLFSALDKVLKKITLNEKKSLHDFSFLIQGLSTLFSTLGAIVHYFITLNSKDEIEVQSEQLRRKLENELIQKKQQYASLFNQTPRIKNNKDDPFAEDEPDVIEQDLTSKKEKLLTEILHLQDTLNNIVT
jgi:hypothetical protein